MKAGGWLGAALVLGAAASGCHDFQSAFSDYCAKSGDCVAGDGGNSDSGNGSGPDGGSADGGNGGGRDGGTDAGGGGACRDFGATCDGYGQCCADAGLACSRIGYCEAEGPGCYADQAYCHQNSDCCDQVCDGGRCQACGDGTLVQSCGRAVDCCYDFGSACAPTNVCIQMSPGLPDGWRCPSADWCNSGYCKPVDAGAGAPPDGVCSSIPDAGGCTPLGTTGGACCPGMMQTTNGCCLLNGQACTNFGDCCSSNCIGGICIAAASGNKGVKCTNDPDCPNPYWCDFVSRTCEDHLCFPTGIPPQYSGCCIISSADSDVCLFVDGGQCLMDGVACNAGPDCCSGICTQSGANKNCNGVIYY